MLIHTILIAFFSSPFENVVLSIGYISPQVFSYHEYQQHSEFAAALIAQVEDSRCMIAVKPPNLIKSYRKILVWTYQPIRSETCSESCLAPGCPGMILVRAINIPICSQFVASMYFIFYRQFASIWTSHSVVIHLDFSDAAPTCTFRRNVNRPWWKVDFLLKIPLSK